MNDKVDPSHAPQLASPSGLALAPEHDDSVSEPLLLANVRTLVIPALDQALDRLTQMRRADGPEQGHAAPKNLLDAMRYAVLGPGKKLRPALVLGGALAVGGRPEDALPAACAVEFVHAYSLVHDDLPALDDDDQRRGMPSCHKRFGEASAILAGDALLTEAFAILVDGRPLQKGKRVSVRRRALAARELARAAGAAGMVGGQHDDVCGFSPRAEPALSTASNKTDDRESDDPRENMRSMHRRKTGRLIQAAVSMGGIMGGGKKKHIRALRSFGSDIGLAFQLIDDALDGDGLARILGQAAVREEAEQLTRHAIHRLASFGEKAFPLAALAQAMGARRI